MELTQIKFLLNLLNKPDYKAPINQINFNSKLSSTEREKICRDLRARQLVSCVEEFTKIKLAPPGEELLKLRDINLPISNYELKILSACAKGVISPGKIKLSPASKKHEIIEQLIARGLIVAEEKKIKSVSLTDFGKNYLAKEYAPSGSGNLTISKKMLVDYLHFLREYLTKDNLTLTSSKPSDDDILQTIIDLNRQLGTQNYLPIFHLREKFKSHLSREELDQALYRLEKKNIIEMSSLVDPMGYTSFQLKAGIPQNSGGCLFFIVVITV